ncbi:MAG: transposase, partial [Syntrophomonas sp.]|nr:transposase [Syntrophomonas sp.]
MLGSVSRAVSYLLELDDKQTGIEYFETLMRYIFSARTDLTRADFNRVVKKIETTYPEGSEAVMTLAEIFREEGREEGMETGEAKALARTAIKLLTKKFGLLPEEFKAGISKLDPPTLDVII